MGRIIKARDDAARPVSQVGSENTEAADAAVPVSGSALDRSLSILDLLATMRGGATVAEIAAAVRTSRSTTYRLMDRLRRRGYIDDNGDQGRWRLGPSAARLALAAVQSTDVAQIAPEYLKMLVQQTRESVNLGIPQGTDIVFIYRDRGPQRVVVQGEVGARRPMHCTSVGKAYLAALPEAEREPLLRKLIYHRYTERTITNRAQLERDLQRTTERGWAEDRGEIDANSTCCAAAIHDNLGRPVAAISVAGLTDRITQDLGRVGPIVASTAEAISRRLGYDPAIDY